MNRMIFGIAALAVLGGCATPTSAPAPQPVREIPQTTEAPKCKDKIECQRMWISAQESAEQLTGMRLRMATDTRLETFAPTRFGRMGAVVLMYPMDDGTFELRADFECYRGSDCTYLRPLAINAFNARVKLAGR
ncbi:hypothetical protein [Variovorax sp. JS1663]|uniref:hypothetical protein n=1 Tax=Variovorax sp. JS1663 TaxID=1851577 RepID=UPI000B345C2C|nr:hypothetical protein [Variovorax sp. JS1663]OUM00548.1 hypothetical protein A8M77_21000 [Variovorax sp. JS1663]